MPSPLEWLRTVVPPPGSSVPEIDWTATERDLGVLLPPDYPGLVEIYGPGSFDDFIWILQPAATTEHLDLVKQRTVRLDALRAVQAEGEVVPYSVEPGSEGLTPWAITDNGDVLYWVTDDAPDPPDWTVAINQSRGRPGPTPTPPSKSCWTTRPRSPIFSAARSTRRSGERAHGTFSAASRGARWSR
jgi:hypothetical protein